MKMKRIKKYYFQEKLHQYALQDYASFILAVG